MLCNVLKGSQRIHIKHCLCSHDKHPSPLPSTSSHLPPPHRHVRPDPQEVPVAGSTLALDEVVAQSIAVGEGVEHVLPVCAGKHKGPSMRQLPAHERLVRREPGGVAEEGVGQSRGKGRHRRKGVLSRSWSLMTKHTAEV